GRRRRRLYSADPGRGARRVAEAGIRLRPVVDSLKILAWLGLIAVALASPGLRAEDAAKTAPAAPTRIVLLVDEIKAICSFPVVLAERLGYLKDGAMDVTVMNIRDDMPSADMLADGRVDAVMAYYHHTIVNQPEGRNFQAIVTLGVTPGIKV